MSFAYGFGLPHWQPLSGGFSPAGLFQAGVIGTFYDPSDLSTLFTTSTGTTPCAVPGSGSQVLVGLMLDKSQGAPGALGAELVTNGDFPVNTTGWTAVNSPTLSVGANGVTIQNNGGTNGLIYQAITTVAGRMYKIEGTITYGGGFARIETSTTIPVTIGGGNINVNASGRYTWYFTAVASITYLVIGNRNDVNAANTYDNISVREIPGNHAIAFNDTTARPELSARVNLLTYSEQFENGVWLKTNLVTSGWVDVAVAPDGTTTADRMIENTTSSVNHYIGGTVSIVSGTTYTLSFYAKTNGRNIAAEFAASGFGSNKQATFNLTAGTTSSLAGVTSSITNAGNGWYRCTATCSATATVSTAFYFILDNNGNQVYTGDGTSGIFIWGADLRPANIGSALPSYQRIADQYTYDSNGFPTYLRFDGVDDSMYTPASINFSGTDKMSVFAGVRKLSDAAQGIFCELSSSTSSNNGTFRMTFPGGTGVSSYAWLSKGTLQASITASLLAAPITNVVTGIGDIANDDCTIRINGPTQVNQSTADQGTGNFGTYPLYIGSRANTSLFFNGYLYSLITAGTQLQSGSITATEQYVAGKTGVQI